jgi:plastocyanin
MINGLNIIGLGCIFTFILYLVKVLKQGPYITHFGKGDTSRIKRVYIMPDNKVTPNGKAILSKFKPKIINIRKGDTVEFINDDKIRHAIEIGNDKVHNSDVLFPGGSFKITIEEDGSIVYRSSLYPHIGHGFINVIDTKSSISSLKGTILANVFGNKKKINHVESEGRKIKTEGSNVEGSKISTESIKTEGILGKKLKNISSITKPLKKRFTRLIKGASSFIGGIGPAIDSIIDIFEICNKKGISECLKHEKTRKVGLYLIVIIVILAAIMYVYKNFFSSKLYLPFQVDGGDIKVKIN